MWETVRDGFGARSGALLGVTLAALGSVLLQAAPARACGGTFCDGGPQAMPVDQTGENILFVVDGDTVEAHIQIQYTGDAMRFAWVRPLPAVPESVSIGSGPLFTALLNSTVPSYGFSTVCGGFALAPVDGGGGVDNGAQMPTAPLSVVTKVVGAFEVSILEGGN